MNLLAETAAAWNLTLTSNQLDQFGVYADELRRWNAHVNLTAITDADGITVRHFLDSLSCVLVWGAAPRSLIDIGTGAGFPGLPLKILRPELKLTLVESVGKKTAFLRHLVELLDLKGVTVLNSRAEQVGHDRQHRQQYDVAVARAVAPLRVLAEYCLPLCRVGGRFLAPKSQTIQDEVAEAQRAFTLLGGRLLEVKPVLLPDPASLISDSGVVSQTTQALSRTIVVVEKIAPTPQTYPRANGVPAHKPLG